MPGIRYGCIIVIFAFLSACMNCNKNGLSIDLSMYQYNDTKSLVKYIHEISLLIERDGLDCLQNYRKKRNRYGSDSMDYYFYVYDMEGTNVFHAGMPELEGKDLSEIEDKSGRKITELVIEALDNKNNPHAWVHYFWWEPGRIYPIPKSSCHFRVKTPDGSDIFVGGGIDYPHEEREFIRIIVDSASDLIKAKGADALTKISDPTSQFNFRDIRVFIFDSSGQFLIQPVVDYSSAEFNVLDFVDESGHKPIRSALKKLEKSDYAWEIIMAKNRYKRQLVKKTVYIRKECLEGREIYISAITDLPQPPFN